MLWAFYFALHNLFISTASRMIILKYKYGHVTLLLAESNSDILAQPTRPFLMWPLPASPAPPQADDILRLWSTTAPHPTPPHTLHTLSYTHQWKGVQMDEKKVLELHCNKKMISLGKCEQSIKATGPTLCKNVES